MSCQTTMSRPPCPPQQQQSNGQNQFTNNNNNRSSRTIYSISSSSSLLSSASLFVTLLLTLLFIILFAFPVQSFGTSLLDRHLRDTNVEQKFILYNNLNISHLLNDPSAFNLSEWHCLLGNSDTDSGSGSDLHDIGKFSSFDELEIQNQAPSSTSECKCFVSFHCEKSRLNLVPSSSFSSSTLVNNQIIWSRCYHLDDTEAYSIIRNFYFEKILNITIEELFKIVQTTSSNEVHLPNKWCDIKLVNSIKLRTDFIQSSSSLNTVYDFVKELANKSDSKHQSKILDIEYQHDSLGIIGSSLESIPSSLLTKLIHLKSLNLTQNRLTQFDSRTLFNSNNTLDQLDLSHNQLTNINLNNLLSLRSISLSNNNLTTLLATDFPADFVRLFQTEGQHLKRTIAEYDLNFANNPWNCNSELTWMIDFISRIVETNGQIFEKKKTKMFQSDEPECDLPLADRMLPFSVRKSVKEMEICNKCRCYLEDKYAKAGYRYVIVNCTDKNLAHLPSHLPKNAKIVDLTNNRIRNLNTLPNDEIDIRTELSHWRNVHKIILQNNSLETLDGIELMESIVYLDISGNLLTEIPYHLLDRVLANKIDKIGIGNNPYTCDCNTIKMQKWLQTNYRIILDLVNVRCGYLRDELTKNESNIVVQVDRYDRLFDRQIIHINSLELCPIASVEFFDILNCILSLTIVILLSKVVYDYLWQKRTGKLPRFFRLNI